MPQTVFLSSSCKKKCQNVIFVVKRYAVFKAKTRLYAVCKLKMKQYAVCKGEGGFTLVMLWLFKVVQQYA